MPVHELIEGGVKMRIIVLVILFLLYLSVLIRAQEYNFKPGIVITTENYEKYISELKKYLTPTYFYTTTNGLKKGWINLPIIETKKYQQPEHFHAATVNYAGKCKVRKDNQLTDWMAGIPFPNPKTALELAWNVNRRHQGTDQYSFYSTFQLFDKGSLERSFRWHLYGLYYNGRVLVPPIPEFPGNNGLLRLKESIVILEPLDVKSFCTIRIRYEDIYRKDDVFSYIPAIRRIRRLTGADTMDPVLGSDCCYDDFEVWRQKINPEMCFKMRKKEFLVPRIYIKHPPEPFVNGDCVQAEWEMRSLDILEVDINDPKYAYSKRVVYVEKQRLTGGLYGGEMYDQKGRLWRGNDMIVHWVMPDTFDGNCYYSIRYIDHLSGHSTLMPMKSIFADPKARPEIFSFRYLLREAK